MMLSVIIPHIGEEPQIFYTIQSIHNDLISIPHEIILIDNAVGEVKSYRSSHVEKNVDRYVDRLHRRGMSEWVRCLTYDTKLSHWNAKNMGVSEAKGNILFFIDAHCVVSPGSLSYAYHYFTSNIQSLEGSLHFPICYLLEDSELIYELIADPSNGICDYRFYRIDRVPELIQVPCMSTCGMMIERRLLTKKLMMWPPELGSYSGGEQYLNFCLAVMGYKVHVLPWGAVFHQGAPRAYRLDWYDRHRNKAIAAFLYGGKDYLEKYIQFLSSMDNNRVPPRGCRAIMKSILDSEGLNARREHIQDLTEISIEDWCGSWEGRHFHPAETPD